MTPTVELLDLPAGYGTPKKPLGWAAVRRDLEQAIRLAEHAHEKYAQSGLRNDASAYA